MLVLAAAGHESHATSEERGRSGEEAAGLSTCTREGVPATLSGNLLDRLGREAGASVVSRVIHRRSVAHVDRCNNDFEPSGVDSTSSVTGSSNVGASETSPCVRSVPVHFGSRSSDCGLGLLVKARSSAL